MNIILFSYVIIQVRGLSVRYVVWCVTAPVSHCVCGVSLLASGVVATATYTIKAGPTAGLGRLCTLRMTL